MKIGRSIYGPYTQDQMAKLADQGLLAPHSRIAKHGSTNWDRASADPAIAEIFGKKYRTKADEGSEHTPAAQNEPTNFALFMDVASI